MKKTPLHAIHTELHAKMAEFAGYDMPIQYADGVMAEHNWTREACGLFDVSHMGQITLEGEGVTDFLEKLTPSSFSGLKENKSKYTVLTNEEGGIIDDLIVTRLSDNKFYAVINAGCKDKDIAWIKSHLPQGVMMVHYEARSLIAVQGPKTQSAVKDVLGLDLSNQNYMSFAEHESNYGTLFITRLGYTGEDGFEISVTEERAADLWNAFMAHTDVKPVGLAARDSLRLEMGYPLYGHDIDATTSPIEADIAWIMGKKSNTGFIGAKRVMSEAMNGAKRQRVGIKVTGRGVPREGTEIFTPEGQKIGELTSGGFSPTLQAAIGQGYIEKSFIKIGTPVHLRVRGRNIEGEIAEMPFVTAKTKKTAKQAA